MLANISRNKNFDILAIEGSRLMHQYIFFPGASTAGLLAPNTTTNIFYTSAFLKCCNFKYGNG